MSSTQYTPGPWTAKFGPGAGGGYQGVDGPNGERIALCDEDTRLSTSTRKANARLIAAAPDLLAALRDTIRAIRDHNAKQTQLWACVVDFGVHAADLTIARAEGRPT